MTTLSTSIFTVQPKADLTDEEVAAMSEQATKRAAELLNIIKGMMEREHKVTVEVI